MFNDMQKNVSAGGLGSNINIAALFVYSSLSRKQPFPEATDLESGRFKQPFLEAIDLERGRFKRLIQATVSGRDRSRKRSIQAIDPSDRSESD